MRSVFLGILSLAASPALAGNDLLPVPRFAIYPGDAISSAMLEEKSLPLALEARSGLHTAAAHVIGKVARRTLLPGQVIPLNAVREPDVVRAGKPVMLVYQTGGLSISSRGVAMQAGAVGDVVSAQNTDSGVIVRGTVQRDGALHLGD